MIARIALIASIAIGLSSCSMKPQTSGTSKITIQLPSRQATSQKVGAFSALPSNQKACFGVNVLAPDIKATLASSCSPETGIVAGFAEAGQSLEVTVARGDNRKFELYMYLLPENDNSPCPGMSKVFAPSQLSKLYYLGAAANVGIHADTVDVTINASFSGVSNTLASQNNYPASCGVASEPTTIPRFHVSSGSQIATGGAMKLSARVGSPTNNPSASGGGMRINKQ